MELDYRDIATADSVDPNDGSYSVIELHREHRVRFLMRTSAGTIILRYMPLRMARIIESARCTIYPTVQTIRDRIEELRPYFDGIPPEAWDKDRAKELQTLERTLQITDMSALGVIVEPPLASMDDYDALMERLTDDERQSLAIAVRSLATPRPPEHVDPTPEVIAKDHGIILTTQEEIEHMTVTQAIYQMARIRREREAIDRMMGRRTVQ